MVDLAESVPRRAS